MDLEKIASELGITIQKLQYVAVWHFITANETNVERAEIVGKFDSFIVPFLSTAKPDPFREKPSGNLYPFASGKSGKVQAGNLNKSVSL